MRLTTLIATALAAVTCTTQAQNILNNGSFETEGPGFVAFESWLNFGNVFAADSGEVIPLDGLLTAKMFGNSDGNQSDQVLQQDLPATEGEIYTLTTHAMNMSSDALGVENLILSQIVFRNAAGSIIQVLETDALDPVTSPMDEWVEATLSGEAPTGTTSLSVFLLHIQLGANAGFPDQGGGASFWDDVTLTVGDAPCSNPADLNGDGVLDFFDVSLFLTNYNEGCP